MIRWLPATPGSLTGGKNRDRQFLKIRELPLKEEPKVFELIPLIHSAGQDPMVNARALHAYMQVGKDFSNWIKDRIRSAGFVEGEDFTIVSPVSANQTGRGGDRRSKEYHATMDMAKELAMLEKTKLGRQARRYFIDCEKQLRARALMPGEAPPNFKDPLVAARFYIEAEEGRRAALTKLDESNAQVVLLTNDVTDLKTEVKTGDAVIRDQARDIDLLISKVEAAKECVTLPRFFKETAAILGYSTRTGFQYLRDADILMRSKTTKWDETYAPTAKWDRKGLFQMVKRTYPRPVKDASGKPTGQIVEVTKPVVHLTPDKKLDGETVTAGGYSWLLRKMMRDPRTTLSRLVAANGGPNGAFAILYGCRLWNAPDQERMLATDVDHTMIPYCRIGTGRKAVWHVARRLPGGKDRTAGWLHTSGPTLADALTELNSKMPPDAPKALGRVTQEEVSQLRPPRLQTV